VPDFNQAPRCSTASTSTWPRRRRRPAARWAGSSRATSR
jgi:hypothetical protein